MYNNSRGIRFRNNVIWARGAGTVGLDIATDSEIGFASDSNDLIATGGSVGRWQGTLRTSLAQWQSATFTDANSLSQDPLFVSPAGSDGISGYGGPGHDGRDDDYHPQSTAGSRHGGSLAPVTSPTTGLPVFPTATLTADAALSPTIDRGEFADLPGAEPAPNGGFLNLGHTGGTTEASLSPDPYVLVTRPDGGEVWPEGQLFPVRWRTPDMRLVGVNLVTNPGNEQPLVNGQIPGWAVAQGTTWGQGTTPAPFAGSYVFAPGTSTPAELRQDIDLSAFASNIAAGGGTFTFGAAVRSANESPADSARVIVEYLNAAKTSVLASYDSGLVTSTGGWQQLSDTRTAPVGSAWARVRLLSTRNTGTTNDGVFDAVSLAATPTVKIELLERSENGGLTPVAVIAPAAPDTGQYDRTIPSNLTPASDYLVRVTRNDSGQADLSNYDFTITGPVHVYYVNDGTVNPLGDLSSAPGDDANDGLSPATPKASIRALLDAYSLGAGDTIRVDDGTYNLTANIIVTAADSGVTILGYNDPAYPSRRALINRGTATAGAHDFDINGATDVTLDHLAITGAEMRVVAGAASGALRLTVRNSEIFGNTTYGVYLQAGDDFATVSNNNIHDNFVTGYRPAGVYVNGAANATVADNVFANNGFFNIQGDGATSGLVARNESTGASQGIAFFGTNTVIRDNLVHGASDAGIIAAGGGLVLHNTAYGEPTGIRSYGAVVRGNTTFLDQDGIAGYSGSYLDGNRSFGNSHFGLYLEYTTTAVNNRSYDNTYGIRMASASNAAARGPYAYNNITYDNTLYGIYLSGGGDAEVRSNTVRQPTGTGIGVDGTSYNVSVRENIIIALAGPAVDVAPDSETLFRSDYNDIYTGGTGSIGRWEGRTFATLPDWFYELGLDGHSRTTDPLFVNPAGPDGSSGFSTAPAGAATVVDDPAATLTGTTSQQAGGYGGTYTLLSGDYYSSDTATWTLSGLVAGQFYRLGATWPSASGLNSGGSYSVYDGTRLIATYASDQSHAPSDFTLDGAAWRQLGLVYVTSTSVTIKLTRNYAYPIAADAVLVQAIGGDTGLDDDFHLQAASPAIDGGDPNDSYDSEPAPNGERIDIGNYGNTVEAGRSPSQSVQILSPTPLDKLNPGHAATISWVSAGVTPDSYYHDLVLADGPVSYYRLGEAPGSTAAADASGNGHTGAYGGGVTLGVNPRRGGGFDTAAKLDGRSGFLSLPGAGLSDFSSGFTAELWVNPGGFVENQRLFDLGNGQSADNIVLQRRFDAATLSLDVLHGSSLTGELLVRNMLSPGRWQHIAVTIDTAGKAVIYRNGQAVGSGNVSAPANTARNSNFVGRSNWAADAYLGGSIDEVAVYNKVLTPWQFASRVAAFGTATIDLLPNGDPSQAIRVASAAPNGVPYAWTVPANLAAGRFSLRVTSNDGSHPQGATSGLFLVAEAGHDYYINDNSTAGNVFTTAAGDNAASGKSPAHPMASLTALANAYHPAAGDVIHLDTGNYVLLQNVSLGAADSGVTLQGPTGAAAVLNRNNTNSGNAAISLTGADDVTIDHIAVTGGYSGIRSYDQGSERITLSNNDVYGNSARGIEVFGYSTTDFTIVGNRIHDNNYAYAGGWGLAVNYGQGLVVRDKVVWNNVVGIEIENRGATPAIIERNTVYNASARGLSASGSMVRNNVIHDIDGDGLLVSGGLTEFNEVYRVGGTGLLHYGGETVRQNSVHEAYNGYIVNSYAENNRSYDNRYAGFVANYSATLRGNVSYGNVYGLLSNSASNAAARGPYMYNNLTYGNSAFGAQINGGGDAQFINNTVFQATGDALRVNGTSYNVRVTNNILWTQGAGYALNIAADSEPLLKLDYNTLIATGTAKLGAWEVADFLTLDAWFHATGQDAHSSTADPRFVNPPGADGVLGYDAATKTDRGLDDNFHLRTDSPAIDAGSPATAYDFEPAPNGERVNVGHDGGTPNATVSPAQAVQVVGPAAFGKVQAGRTAPISWLVSGVTPDSYYSDIVSADGPVSYYRLGDAPGSTAAADASGNGHTGAYSAGLTLGANPRRGGGSDTAARLDGSSGSLSIPAAGMSDFSAGFSAELWVNPTAGGNYQYQRLFDFGNGPAADNILLFRYFNPTDLTLDVYRGSSLAGQLIVRDVLTLGVCPSIAFGS